MINVKRGKFLATGMQVQQLIRARLRKILNNLRRPHPGPRKATLFDPTAPEVGVELRWKGPPPPPQTLSAAVDFLNVGTLKFTTPFVLSIRNGSVVGVRGDVVTAVRNAVYECVARNSAPQRSSFFVGRWQPPEAPARAGYGGGAQLRPLSQLLPLSLRCDEPLASVPAGRHIGRLLLRDAEYALSARTGYLFGIREDQIIPLEKGTHLVAEQLLVCSLPGLHQISEQVHLKDINTYRFVRETILAHVNKVAAQPAS